MNVALDARLAGKIVIELRKSAPAKTTVENVVFGLARRYTHGDRTVLRVERLETFDDADYAVRELLAVQLRPEALARVVGAVSRSRLVPVKFHRHPPAGRGVLSFFSNTDDAADRELAVLFKESTPFTSVLLADQHDGGYGFLARSIDIEGTFTPATVVELRLPLRVHCSGARVDLARPRYSRARLEFGEGIVNALSELRAGIVGTGGLGWRSGTVLADSGIGSLVPIDHQAVEERNVLRLEGTTGKDVGKDKVVALRDYLGARHPDLDVAPLKADVIEALDSTGDEHDVLVQALGSCDVLLLVTDNHPSRLSVMIEAERIGVPYIHCGMHPLTPHDMYSRLSVHVPRENPCAVCAGNVDRAAGSRRGRGYIEGVELPNVAAWNATVAGYVANALRMLAVPLPGEGLRDIHAWEVGLSRPSTRPMTVTRDAACPTCAA